MWSTDVKTAKKRRRVEQAPKRGIEILVEPVATEDLATHSRKIKEVCDWLSQAGGHSRMLLLTGPAGCGKTVTLRAVAKSLGMEIQEWINPMDKVEFDFKDWLDDTYDRGSYFEPKQIEKFESFLLRCSRYQTLFANGSKRLILIEDFPNYIIWKPAQLHELLRKYKALGQCPIVFICTDDDKLNLSHNIFPPDLRFSLCIDNIKFNPLPHTALMKVLKRYGPSLSKDSLEDLARSSNGDIRAALNSMRFSSAGGNSAGTVSKDVTTEYYKVLGRILYPKRLEERSSRGAEFLYNIQIISDHFTGSFLGMLHENFLNTFSILKDVIKGSEVFSDCDLISSGGDELNQYVSLICTAGLMCANKQPKKGSFKPLLKSRFAGLHRESQNVRRYPQFGHTSRVLNLDIIPYVANIPRYATQISSFDTDRLRSNTFGRGLVKPDVFKVPFPVKSESERFEEEDDFLIEEFDD